MALYGSESYTIMKDESRKLEVFETWCWQRVLQIYWIERVKNEEEEEEDLDDHK